MGRSLAAFAAIALSIALNARAEDAVAPLAIPDQAIYKGLVGNALELLPLEDDVKVRLQRTNAIVSGPMTARSLALLLGVASPVLIVPGVIWGIWSAFNIKERKPDVARWLGNSLTRVGFCAHDGAATCTLRLPEPHDASTEVAQASRSSEPEPMQQLAAQSTAPVPAFTQ